MTKQNKWDCFLITSFYRRPDMRMRVVIEIYNDDVTDLLRTPVNDSQQYDTVRVFICSALKRLSSILFRHEITEAYDIAMTLPDSCCTADVKRKSRFTKDEAKELRSDRSRYRANSLERIAMAENRYKHSHQKAVPLNHKHPSI